MTIIATENFSTARVGRLPGPRAARGLLVLAVVAAGAAAILLTPAEATSRAAAEAGPDLTRLLRGMAMLKALMAAAVAVGVVWRLGLPVAPARLAAHVLACAAMAAGPVLVWDMVHVGTGALLLHGGLLAALLLLWRDPTVAARLSAAVATRRTALRSGP